MSDKKIDLRKQDNVILVEVRGGVVQAAYDKKGKHGVLLLDWDNIQSGDDFLGMEDPDEIEKWQKENFPKEIFLG